MAVAAGDSIPSSGWLAVNEDTGAIMSRHPSERAARDAAVGYLDDGSADSVRIIHATAEKDRTLLARLREQATRERELVRVADTAEEVRTQELLDREYDKAREREHAAWKHAEANAHTETREYETELSGEWALVACGFLVGLFLGVILTLVFA